MALTMEQKPSTLFQKLSPSSQNGWRVRGAQKYFWTLVKNWKLGRNSELHLCSDEGRLKVSFSADLGVWDPLRLPDPLSPHASRGHQGTRSAGPSRMRRREKRAAAKAATAASESTENVKKLAADSSEEVTMTKEALAAEEAVNALSLGVLQKDIKDLVDRNVQ